MCAIRWRKAVAFQRAIVACRGVREGVVPQVDSCVRLAAGFCVALARGLDGPLRYFRPEFSEGASKKWTERERNEAKTGAQKQVLRSRMSRK
jgi:hypothetical protein